MKKNLKKVLAVLLCVSVLMSFASLVSFGASDVLTYSVTDLGYAQVSSCSTSAKGEITVPKTATIDGKEYEVKKVGDSAFSGCTKVTKIVIEEGVRIIGSKAFASCTALKTVNVPSTLVTCAFDAFDGCNTVTLNCYKSNYQFFTIYGFFSNVVINVVDADEQPDSPDTDKPSEDDGEKDQSEDIFAKLFSIFKKIVETILSLIGIKF